MEFYYFGGNTRGDLIPMLEQSNFSGVMFTYDATQGDIFTHVAKDIKNTKRIKYLIAIRPYAISPQYICMINQSIQTIEKNRLQVNFISGYIKDHEKDFGGIVGEINDSSSRIDRSNYMIEYLNVLNNMPINKNNDTKLDFYVSTTNEYVFDFIKRNQNKIILPYRDYKNGYWTISNNKGGQMPGDAFSLSDINCMIAITPIIRETQEELNLSDSYAQRPVWRKGERANVVTDIEYFTYEQFDSFVKKLESEGIHHMLLNGWPEIERENIIKFIKKYTELAAIK